MGSGSGKPCHTRLEHPTAVERHCPVPKGLRLALGQLIPLTPHVERHCPVPKGLRLSMGDYKGILSLVERHCPVPKGLRQDSNTSIEG